MLEFFLNVTLIFSCVHVVASLLNYSQDSSTKKKHAQKEEIRKMRIKAITGKRLSEKEWLIIENLSEQSSLNDYLYNKEV